uniref:Purple acid phosphatase n=1 Tax=Rhizophora mucronata TaxID=61149 RepID=A0A2P2IUD9_RHIMU
MAQHCHIQNQPQNNQERRDTRRS